MIFPVLKILGVGLILVDGSTEITNLGEQLLCRWGKRFDMAAADWTLGENNFLWQSIASLENRLHSSHDFLVATMK